jgi:hypothetical protein
MNLIQQVLINGKPLLELQHDKLLMSSESSAAFLPTGLNPTKPVSFSRDIA